MTAGKRGVSRVRRPRRWRLTLVLLCVATALLARPDSVLAHAELVGATPGPGETVAREPHRIRLQFSEPLNHALSGIAVWDARASRVDRTSTFNVRGNQMFVSLAPHLGPGTYLVAWSAISADDGHATTGTYRFNLGRAGPISPRAWSLVHRVDSGVPATLARWVELTAGALWMGLMVVSVFVVRRRTVPADMVERSDRKALDRAFKLVPPTLVLLLVASMLTLILQVHAVIPDWSRDLSGRVLESLTFQTPYGELWCVRQVLVVVALGLWGMGWGIRRRSASLGRAEPVTPWGGEAVVDYSLAVLVGYDLILASSGHAASLSVGGGGILGAPVLLDWLHVLASGMWIGGIGAIVAVLAPLRYRTGDVDESISFLDRLDRFSPLAYASVAILAITGTFNADVHLTGWPDLWLTIYGRALLAKLSAILAVVILSGISVAWIRPRMRRLSLRSGTGAALAHEDRLLTRSLRVSAALGVAVFLATAVMNTYPIAGGAPLAGPRRITNRLTAANAYPYRARCSMIRKNRIVSARMALKGAVPKTEWTSTDRLYFPSVASIM